MPYQNYRGGLMTEAAQPTQFVNGSSAGNETLTAPNGPSAVDPGTGAGDVMIGSSGDNIFYIRDATDRVQVASGLSGVKAVTAYTSFMLPANVQNLEVYGSYNFAVGNGQDNLIVGHSDHQTLYGGPGSDVLVGAGNEASYVVATGEGSDVIYNFTLNDTVRLIGSAFRSFGDVQGAMRQQGADVIVQIDASETLTLRNLQMGQLGAKNFLLPLDRSKLGALTFGDEFNGLQLYNYQTGQGQWLTNFGSDPTKHEAYTLTQNGEQQVYTSPAFQGTTDRPLGYNPFSVSNGIVTITATPIPQANQAAAFGGVYSSGMLDTRGIFEQKYGYFEIRMALPTAKGAWPAFWMAPDPNTNGAEIDIGENIAITPNVDHIRGYADGQVVAFAEALKTGDPSGFHNYGLMWTPSTVTYYYDDVAVYQTATPAGWNAPMYMLANLAVGGYGGQPDASQFPAQLQIDYVHAYALADGSSVVERGAPPPLVAWRDGSDGSDTLQGSNTYANNIRGFGGDDQVTGGLGADTLNGNIGNDTVVGRSQVGGWLFGGQGDDLVDLRPSSGHNDANGNRGADTLYASNGGDTLRGGQNEDRLYGGNGADWLSGDLGSDTLTGGGGADTFHMVVGGGSDIVTDFNRSQGDRVQLDWGVSYQTAQVGADVVITLSGGGTMTLQNVSQASLDSGWIVVG